MLKKLFILPALLVAAFMTTTITSCGDNCKDVDCGNGTCLDGTCECGDGYEGTNCEAEWTTKFLGSYLGSDVVTASTAGTPLGTYNLASPAIVTRKSETVISISNFGGFDSICDATIDRPATSTASATTLSIDYVDPTGRKFVGTASISGTTLSGSYVVTFSDNTTDTATFSYSK
jgi:hypothetical protein